MNFIDAVYIMKLYEIKIFSSLREKNSLFLFGFVKNGLFIYFYIYRYTHTLGTDNCRLNLGSAILIFGIIRMYSV